MKRWRVYMLRCADGSLYTGISNDVAARLAAHNAGKGAKYTRSRLPVALAWSAVAASATAARKREAAIKALVRGQKERLLARRFSRRAAAGP